MNETPDGLRDVNPPITPEMLVPRLGDYLVERGLIRDQDLHEALARQAELRKDGNAPLLGEILVQMNTIDRATLDRCVTEQILQLRNALQEANAQLEARVRQRTAELQEALNRLSELNKLKSNFVANISHELRTPLTHLNGYLELLAAGDLGDLSVEQKQAVGVMTRSTERLTQLIEDLILFSMEERGQVTLRLSPTRVDALCSQAYARMQPRALENHLTLEVHCMPEMPAVEADQDKILWVLNQLLDNAIKFTPEGGTVALYGDEDGGLIRLAVTDTGIGIPENRLNEIFEPFHKLDGSSTRRYGGTGMGLSLVKKIVEAHGSVIHVTSAPGKGSQFEFFLRTPQVTP